MKLNHSLNHVGSTITYKSSDRPLVDTIQNDRDGVSRPPYRVRLFYFVFAVLLYNVWRLTDFLLKAGVEGEMDYAPV